MVQNKLLFVLIAIISIIAIISYLASPIFEVHSININDLKFISKTDIRSDLVHCNNKNIWLITKNDICKRIKTNNYVKSVDIKKKYPDSLKINIIERTPLAKINNNGQYTVFTVEGFILEEGAMKTGCKIPLLVGTGYSFSGNKLKFPDKTEKIIQALDNIGLKARSTIKKITINNGKNIKLVLTINSQPEVYLGTMKEIVKKFKVYSSIYQKINSENININYIDLRVVDKPVICRKK